MKAHGQSTTSSQTSSDEPEQDEKPPTIAYEYPKYRCEKCRDMGLWEPEYGKGWVPCECQKIREAERRIERSGLAGEIQEKTFKNFKTDADWQRMMKEKAIDYGKAYFEAKEAGGKYPWFFIAGNPGCGKTHLCTAICGAMLARNVPVIYMQWVTESRKLRGYVNDPEAYDTVIAPYIDVEVLYIDDLFKQRGHKEINVTDAEGKVLFEILNNRYIQNKSTIISTEWYLETELMGVDDGTFSRVYERCKGFTVSIERDKSKNYRIVGGNHEG